MDLKGHANAVAAKLKQFGAFPIAILIPFITTLFQQLLTCLQPKTENAEDAVKSYVSARWSPEAGYSESLMRRAKYQTRRAARKKGLGKLTDDQQTEAATAALDVARLGTGFGAAVIEALADAD